MELYFNDKTYNTANEFIYESYSLNEDDTQQQAQANSDTNKTQLTSDDFEPKKFAEKIKELNNKELFKSFIDKLTNKSANGNQVDYSAQIAKLDSILDVIKNFNIENIQVLSSIKQPTNA